MSNNILERSKLALRSYKEALVLRGHLESLNTQINEAESILEAHINSVEIINVEELQDQITAQQDYLDELNSEISVYNNLPSTPDSPLTEDEINILLEESVSVNSVLPVTLPLSDSPDTISTEQLQVLSEKAHVSASPTIKTKESLLRPLDKLNPTEEEETQLEIEEVMDNTSSNSTRNYYC